MTIVYNFKIQIIINVIIRNRKNLNVTNISLVTRYKMKNGLEDLKKAQWYLQRLIKKYENN